MEPMPFLDFFAGVGMVGTGLGPSWRCVCANDIDPKKAAAYRLNFDPALYRLEDIANVGAAELPPALLAWASFPCVDLSLAGTRAGMSPSERSGVVWRFLALMQELHAAGRQPPLIVLENVAGLLSSPGFPVLCAALAGLDARFGAVVIDAARFVPQSRPRVFLIAADARLDLSPWTAATPEPWTTTPTLIAAAADLPSDFQARWVWWTLPEPETRPAPVATLIESAAPWWTAAETDRLLSQMADTHRAAVEAKQAEGGRQIGFAYRRTRGGVQRAECRFDGLAGCLRMPAGGSSKQLVIEVDAGAVRSRWLSPREAARLMGLPDSFRLPSNVNQALAAMGDGVAVPAVRHLADHLLTRLATHLHGVSAESPFTWGFQKRIWRSWQNKTDNPSADQSLPTVNRSNPLQKAKNIGYTSRSEVSGARMPATMRISETTRFEDLSGEERTELAYAEWERRRKLSALHSGKTVSEETREKQREAARSIWERRRRLPEYPTYEEVKAWIYEELGR